MDIVLSSFILSLYLPLKADLDEAKKQLEDAKQRLKDEREIQESKMAELEEQVVDKRIIVVALDDGNVVADDFLIGTLIFGTKTQNEWQPTRTFLKWRYP